MIQPEQRFALLCTLAAHTRWNSLATEQVQAGISVSAEELDRIGREFTTFVKNGFCVQVELPRETGELTIQIPALPRPTLGELQKERSWIKSIERDTSPECPVVLKLITVLHSGENSIGGKEYERRLVRIQNDALGWQHRKWLLENQDNLPEFVALRGGIYIDFPGLVVVGENGRRLIPFARDVGKRWSGRWFWVDDDFDSGGRLALSGK